MGQGSTVIQSFNSEKKYYCSRIDDPVYPDSNFVIVPLNGSNGSKFFYISQTVEGLGIMGEGYVTPSSKATAFAKEETKEVEKVRFLVTEPNGDIVKNQEEALQAILKQKYKEEYHYHYHSESA